MAAPSEEIRPAGDEEEDEEDVDDTDYKTVKDAVLFAIDVSSSMLQRPPPSDNKKVDRDCATAAALKCAYQLMQQRIISNPNDMMGILLFGTESSNLGDGGDSPYPHCWKLADLDVPSAEDVRTLRDLVEDEEEAAKILKPSREGASMATVLFCANQIFTTKAPNFSSRRLFLVTDNDTPAHDKVSKDTAVTRARDLYDLGVLIELFPIGRPGYGFDRAKFYDDLVYPTTPNDQDAPAGLSSETKVATSGDGISLLQSLLSSINSKAAPRRALFNLPLELGPDLRIGVKGYILIKRQEPVKSCYIWLNGEHAQIVTSSTSHLADDTARVVEKTELRKAYKFGGDAITFSEDEFKQIRQCFGEPVIRIIGFKPISMLPIWANTNKATFIYPSEQDYIGSTRVFSALQRKLLEDQKMGLAWFVARRNAAPVIAAVLPGAEKLGEHGEQIMPPGLWLVPLPFADDIRPFPETSNTTKTTGYLTDGMRKIIQQLQLPKGIYDPAKYPNPSLQWFYRILQAIALQEELPEKAEDKTIPKYKQIDKRAGDFVLEWGSSLESEYTTQTKSSKSSTSIPSRKRATPSDPKSSASTSKKIKTEPASQNGGSVSLSDEAMAALNDRGIISKQKVDVLKEFLGSRGLSGTGKKIDLVERVQGYLGKKGF